MSEFNITSLFYEIARNEKYELPEVKTVKGKEESTSAAKLEGAH